MASKMLGIPILRILGWDSQLGNFSTKWHLDATLVVNYKTYYKREGGSFSQIQAMVSLVNLCMFVACLCTKKCSKHTLTNSLFGLCKFMWIINSLIIHPNPILEFQHACLHSKCFELRNIPQLFFLLLFSLLDSHLNLSKNAGVHHQIR